MTKEEYVRSLVDDNVPGDQWFDLVKQWEVANPETEEVEEVEEVVEEGNSNDLPPAGADVDQEIVAPESTEATESQSEDGSSAFTLPTLTKFTAPNSIFNDKKGFGSNEFMFEAMNDIETDFMGIKSMKLTPEQKAQNAKFKEFTKVAKPGESYGDFDNNYDYKYDIVDNDIKYYQKAKDDKEFTEATKENGDLIAVATVFGHTTLTKKDLEKEARLKKAEKDFNNMDFSDIVMTQPKKEERLNSVFAGLNVLGNDLSEDGTILGKQNIVKSKEDLKKDWEMAQGKFMLGEGVDPGTLEQYSKNNSGIGFNKIIGTEEVDTGITPPTIDDMIGQAVYDGRYHTNEPSNFRNFLNEITKFGDISNESYAQDYRDDAGYGGVIAPAAFELNNAYDFDSLPEGIDAINFLGMMANNGLGNQYVKDINNVGEGESNKYFGSEENEIGRQRHLWNNLSSYVQEEEELYQDKILLNWINKNKDKVKNADSILEAKEIAKEYFKKEYGQDYFPTFDRKELQEYKENQFPELVENDKLLILKAQEKKQQRINESGLGGVVNTVSESIENAYDTVVTGKIRDMAYLTGDILGLPQMSQLKIRANELDRIDQADDLNFYYVSGKKAIVDGITYYRDEAGTIYNSETGMIETTLNEDEFKKINGALEESKTTGSDYNLRGGVTEFAGVAAGLAFDVAMIYATSGVGGALSKAPMVGRFVGLANTIKLSPATMSTMSYYGATTYASTKRNVFKQFTESGMTDEQADGLATDAARLGSVWAAVTSMALPSSQYIKKAEKIFTNKSIFSNALKAYKKGGPGAYRTSLYTQFKNIMPTKQGGINLLKASGGEFIQENLQGFGEEEIINKIINKRAAGIGGSKFGDVLDQDYTFNDFWRNSLISVAAGGLTADVQTGFGGNPKKQLQNLFYVGTNLSDFKDFTNKAVVDGELSKADADAVVFNAKAVVNQTNKMPATVSAEIAIPSAILMQQIADLETKIKNTDSAFQGPINEEIKTKKTELNNLASKDIDKGSAAIAGQVGTEINAYKTTTEVETKVNELISEGAKIDKKASTNYGTFLKITDPKTGKVRTEIIINQEIAAEDRVITTQQHEVLHAVLDKTFASNPKVAISVGKDLIAQLKKDSDSGKIVFKNKDFQNRLNSYIADVDYDNASTLEETFNLLSEGLTDRSIVINETIGTQIGNFIRRALSAVGVKASFKNGVDAINFIKDYNNSVAKGKGLTLGQLKTAKTGADVDQDIEATDLGGELEAVDLGVVKSSKKKELPVDTQTYMELDNDILQQSLVSEIESQGPSMFPIAQAITEKNWPLISKSLTINSEAEMNVAKEIVIDQMLGQFQGSGNGKYSPRNTSALAGFSLDPQAGSSAAQVSTYLAETIRRRKPEIDIAIKEQTGSTVELDTNTSEEVASVTTETLKPKAKKSPKGDAVYSSVLAENLGSDVATAVNAAIETDLLDMNVGDRFGNTKNIGPKLGEVLGKMFGLDSRVFTDKSWNIKQGDLAGLTNLKQYLNSNAINDFKLLPDAYNSKGKSNFIPDNILNKLYTKDGKNKWKKDPSKTITDYKALLGEMVKPVYRAAEATTVKGLAGLSFRNKMFETAVPDPIKRKTTGVKFSKRKIKPETVKKELDEISISKNSKQQNKVIGESDLLINNNNRVEMQEGFQSTIETQDISLEAFNAGNLQNSGAERVRLKNEDVVYSLSNGKTIPGVLKGKDKNGKKLFDPPTVESIIKIEGKGVTLVAARNRLYYGKSDPAYIKAKESATKNSDAKKAQRVTAKQAGTKKGNEQAVINQDTLERVALELEAAVANGMPMEFATMIIQGSYQATTGLTKIAAPIVAKSINPEFAVEGKPNQTGGKEAFREEHSPPASVVGASLIWAIKNGQVSSVMEGIRSNYVQVLLSKADDVKIDQAGLDSTLPDGVNIMTPNAGIRRFAAAGINLNTIIDFKTGKTFADIMNVGTTNKASKRNPNIVYAQNALISEQITNDLDGKTTKARIKAYEPVADLEFKASKRNTVNFGDKVNNEMTVADQLTMLGIYDKAASVGRKLDTPKKGISVFDFDDTLAKTKEKVIVNNSDGTTIEISAAKFAEQASDLEAEGATFDFSNFDNVVNAKKGPLADLALKRQDKFGSKDIFVLTARPQIAAQGIKKFLDGIGLNLPLSNITGLENGTPGAKGNWVASKAAEGYNDFYFADDAYKNVQAVQEVLSQIDVNSVVQVAKSSKRKTFDRVFNNILESSTGIETFKEYSRARAQTVGATKGRFSFFTTPSAEDFVGLLYKTLGKGKVGNAQIQFYKDNLIDPYNRAEIAVTKAKITAANSFKALKTNLKTLPKSLSKQTGIGGFTFGQAARVAVWSRQGMEVPGLSKRDLKELNDFVDKNPELNVFADELVKIQKGKPYPKPGQNWLGGNITSDILNDINKSNRKEYLQEWQENVDIIFSDKNMNKLEAAYGPKYVEALRDQLARMKSGSNRPIGGSRIVNQLLDWLNNSVGAVMFLNTRSAVLQTLSAVNFINFGNNNIYKAGKAFANQPQFWKDFKTLMNSPYLVERRNGLKINVSESEIADAVAESSNKVKSGISYLLNKGFIFTRIADSFAIASGGATFYRNQLDAYLKDGVPQKEAEKRAFDDFYAIAEENQQSSNPSKISQQQASGAGRVVLAFANTPMQYARIIKRSSQDLINGRGDWKSNVSKIVYYAAIQNIAFNALQNALFAEAFGEDEEEDEEQSNKQGRIANGMADSLLRGLGIQGAAVSALKNSLITIANENDKKSPKFVKAVYDLFDFSPPLDSKFRKLRSGANTITWERENIKNKGFDLNNPAYLASAQIVSGLTNLPLDRAIQKMNNIRAIMSNSSQNWQKVAMALGWSTWDVGLPYYGVDDKVEMTPKMILKEKVITMKKDTSTKQQKDMLLELGLTKQQIKALKYEETRIKKILELQEKNLKK